jgi:hypothetical protein
VAGCDVVGAFGAVAVDVYPFDDAWVAAVLPWWVRAVEDLSAGGCQGQFEAQRGKSPPGW